MQPAWCSHTGSGWKLLQLSSLAGFEKDLRHFTKSNQKDQESKKETWGLPRVLAGCSIPCFSTDLIAQLRFNLRIVAGDPSAPS